MSAIYLHKICKGPSTQPGIKYVGDTCTALGVSQAEQHPTKFMLQGAS